MCVFLSLSLRLPLDFSGSPSPLWALLALSPALTIPAPLSLVPVPLLVSASQLTIIAPSFILRSSLSTPPALQDAAAEPLLAGTRAGGSLPMAAPAAGRGLLAAGPRPGLDLHLLQQLSPPPMFPAAPNTQLVLGSPGPGECGQQGGLGNQGGWTSCRVRNGAQGLEWSLGQKRSQGGRGAPLSVLILSSALPSRLFPHPVLLPLACFGVHFLPVFHTLVHPTLCWTAQSLVPWPFSLHAGLEASSRALSRVCSACGSLPCVFSFWATASPQEIAITSPPQPTRAQVPTPSPSWDPSSYLTPLPSPKMSQWAPHPVWI